MLCTSIQQSSTGVLLHINKMFIIVFSFFDFAFNIVWENERFAIARHTEEPMLCGLC